MEDPSLSGRRDSLQTILQVVFMNREPTDNYKKKDIERSLIAVSSAEVTSFFKKSLRKNLKTGRANQLWETFNFIRFFFLLLLRCVLYVL